jgi:cellulose synthase operon protein C
VQSAGGHSVFQQNIIIADGRSLADIAVQYINQLLKEDKPLPLLTTATGVLLINDSGGSEDPINRTLDRQIDGFRDHLQGGRPKIALTGFTTLLNNLPPTATARILFRLKANIGSCHQRLGHYDEAAAWLMEGFDHAPDEPKAKAHKAVAFLLRQMPGEAYAYAHEELVRDPGNEFVAAIAIQAAALLPQVTDPLAGIAPSLRERREIQFAHQLFYAIRGEIVAWAEHARAALRRFPADLPLGLYAAQAEIQLYVQSSTYIKSYRIAEDDKIRLTGAVERLQSHWDERREGEYPEAEEDIYIASAAMVGWHLLNRPENAGAIAEQLLKFDIKHPQMMINAGRILSDGGQPALAEKAFAVVADHPEGRWSRVLLAVQQRDWMKAAAIVAGGDVPEEERILARTFTALAPFMTDASATAEDQLSTILEFACSDPRAAIAVAGAARRHGFSSVAQDAFTAALNGITAETSRQARFIAANYARQDDKPAAVIDLLDKVVPTEEASDTLLWSRGACS